MNLRDKLIILMIGLILIMCSNAMRLTTQAIMFDPGITALKNIPAQGHAFGANRNSLFLSKNIF